LIVISPGNDGAVGLEGQRVVAAGRHRDDIVETGWHIGLAIAVGAEGRYRAIRLQDDGMQNTGRDEGLVAGSDAGLEILG
jgi:hypothetical protein